MTSRHDRLTYISERLHTDWGWVGFEKQKGAKSLRDIALAVARAFGDPEVHPLTIARDIKLLRERSLQPSEEELTEAQRLLLPENFADFRRLVPGQESYETPMLHYAVFRVMHSLTYKVDIPPEVIKYLDYWDPEHPLPKNINELIQSDDIMLTFQLLLAPRHGKTDLTIAFMHYCYAKDKSTEIMWGNGTLEKTKNFAQNAVLFGLEEDNEFTRLFGPFKDDDRPWSKAGVKLRGAPNSKEMSLQPFGISSNIRSFGGNIIIADDLADKRRAESATTTEMDFEWLTTELFTRREPETSVLHLGSHLPVDHGDLFSWVEDAMDRLNQGNHVIVLKKLPAHEYSFCDPVEDPEHTKCVIYPERRSYKYLEGMRGLMKDDVMFEAVFNQKPRSASMLHFPGKILREQIWFPPANEDGLYPAPKRGDQLGSLNQWLQTGDIPRCCKNQEVLCVMGFDPGGGKTKDSAFSSLVILGGCVYCGRRYVIDWWKERMSPETHPDTMRKWLEQYRIVKHVSIETNALQTGIARDPRMDKVQLELGVEVIEHETDERKWDPSLGIPTVARHSKNGMFSIPAATVGDLDYWELFIKELIRWPKKPNDAVMALWFADRALTNLIEDSRTVMAEIMPGAEKWLSQWQLDSVIEVDLSLIGMDEEYAHL